MSGSRAKVRVEEAFATATTAVETDEEVRRLQRSRGRGDGEPALRSRPVDRPPMAVLTVCDDGSDEGEEIRLRGDRFIIGRTAGDLTIPHDGRISSRHVEVARREVDGAIRWVVSDLRSRNGLFVRVSCATLADGSEFLVGRGRYRFDAPRPAPERPGRTRGHGDAPAAPGVSEMLAGGLGARVVLDPAAECWIGSDPSCLILRPDDRFCDRRHARLRADGRGRWRLDHAGALNGVWLRVDRVVVERSLHFQAGEQRFRLRA